MKYEYYYLFGLDIPLDRYGLGVIKQPKLIDYISKEVDIETFYLPFIMSDILISQVDDKESLIKIKDRVGSLGFILVNCYQTKRFDIINSLIESLKLLYNNENVVIGESLNILIDDVEINNHNFDILGNVVLEMMKIDKSKLKFDKPKKKEMSDIEKEFERRRQKYLEMTNKKDKNEPLTLVDIANVVVHSGTFKYEDVLNMTIYQLKNSFDIINKKEAFDINTLCRVSPKFDMSKEKYEHWTEKIKLDKSTLSK